MSEENNEPIVETKETHHQSLVDFYDGYLSEYAPKFKIGDVGCLRHTGCPGLFTILGEIPAAFFIQLVNIRDILGYPWSKFDENWYKKTVYFCLFHQCQKASSLKEFTEQNPHIKEELLLDCYEKQVPYAHCVWASEADIELFND